MNLARVGNNFLVIPKTIPRECFARGIFSGNDWESVTKWILFWVFIPYEWRNVVVIEWMPNAKWLICRELRVLFITHLELPSVDNHKTNGPLSFIDQVGVTRDGINPKSYMTSWMVIAFFLFFCFVFVISLVVGWSSLLIGILVFSISSCLSCLLHA